MLHIDLDAVFAPLADDQGRSWSQRMAWIDGVWSPVGEPTEVHWVTYPVDTWNYEAGPKPAGA